MDAKDCLELLKREPVFWSRLGFAHHPPCMDSKGDFIVMSDFDACSKLHRKMSEDGVNIHTSILFSGWTGPGEYNFATTEQTLAALFKNAPDIWYIPRIKIDAPVRWLLAHPEEVAVYHNGPKTVEDVAKRLREIAPAYEGKGRAPAYHGGDIDSRIGVQSFSSTRWLDDAKAALKKLIDRLENGPYGKRILAYHVGHGVCGETNCNGVLQADHSISNRSRFFRWAVEKYKSREGVAKAWGETNLEESSCSVPLPEDRCGAAHRLEAFFRHGPKGAKNVDYDIFLNESNAIAIEELCRTAKESSGKAAGAFFGYIFETVSSSASGYLDYDRILASPHVDFVASPKSYYRCGPGEAGGVQAVAQSFNRNKLYLDEMDIRLHTAKTTSPQCADIEETRYVLWREFAKNQQNKSGFWWMDLGGDWYEDPDTRAEAGKIAETWKELDFSKASGVSEILLVADEREALHRLSNVSFHRLVMQRFQRELAHCAAPVDLYRLADLQTLDLSGYKMIIFLNGFAVEAAEWELIKARIAPRSMLVYNYAFGAVGAEGFSLANIEKLSGFKLEAGAQMAGTFLSPVAGGVFAGLAAFDSNRFSFLDRFGETNFSGLESSHVPSFPFLRIAAGEGIEAELEFDDGSAALASRRNGLRREVFNAMPFLETAHFRRLAELAGCHLYSAGKCAVYANSQFVGAFAKDKEERSIRLPSKGSFKDCLSGESFHNADALPLKNGFGFFKRTRL